MNGVIKHCLRSFHSPGQGLVALCVVSSMSGRVLQFRRLFTPFSSRLDTRRLAGSPIPLFCSYLLFTTYTHVGAFAVT